MKNKKEERFESVYKQGKVDSIEIFVDKETGVNYIYKHFGYSLPRVAADQAGAGRKVSVSNLQPGDLLFYHGYGHVAIYIGGGQVVHASNAATGIKISKYNYSPIDKAVRIVN